MMSNSSNFKANPNPNVENTSSIPLIGNPSVVVSPQSDPPNPPTFPKAVVLDSLRYSRIV